MLEIAMTMHGSFDFALIIPTYNYAKNISHTLAKVKDWRIANQLNFLLCIVDDGSEDATYSLISEFQAANATWCKIHKSAENMGKGHAIRAGIKLVDEKVPYHVFSDCDLHYGLNIIHERLIPALKNGAEIVILDRSWHDQFHSGSTFRRFLSHGFIHLKTILTGVPYEDTQAGLKGFRSDFSRAILPIAKIDGFAFDVELLSIAILARFPIERIPILLSSKHSAEQTSVTFGKALKMFWDLLRIASARYSGKYTSVFFSERIERGVYEIKENYWD